MDTAPVDPHTGLALAQPAGALVTDADLERLAWAEAMHHGHATRERILAAGIEHALTAALAAGA